MKKWSTAVLATALVCTWITDAVAQTPRDPSHKRFAVGVRLGLVPGQPAVQRKVESALERAGFDYCCYRNAARAFGFQGPDSIAFPRSRKMGYLLGVTLDYAWPSGARLRAVGGVGHFGYTRGEAKRRPGLDLRLHHAVTYVALLAGFGRNLQSPGVFIVAGPSLNWTRVRPAPLTDRHKIYLRIHELPVWYVARSPASLTAGLMLEAGYATSARNRFFAEATFQYHYIPASMGPFEMSQRKTYHETTAFIPQYDISFSQAVLSLGFGMRLW